MGSYINQHLSSSITLFFFSKGSSSGKAMSNLTMRSPLCPAFPFTGIPLPASTLLVWGDIISSKCRFINSPPSYF